MNLGVVVKIDIDVASDWRASQPRPHVRGPCSKLAFSVIAGVRRPRAVKPDADEIRDYLLGMIELTRRVRNDERTTVRP